MKKLDIKKIKKELKEYSYSETEIILNNVLNYNKLVDQMNELDTPQTNQQFLLIQLNGQIFKQINELKKMKLKEAVPQDLNPVEKLKLKIETR